MALIKMLFPLRKKYNSYIVEEKLDMPLFWSNFAKCPSWGSQARPLNLELLSCKLL